MGLMLPAIRTELLQFETLGSRLLVLGARVVFTFTLGALQCNLLSRHFSRPLKSGAVDQD